MLEQLDKVPTEVLQKEADAIERDATLRAAKDVVTNHRVAGS